jgi:pyruvate/2-oxoglutarate dehydrogenase complex dihydrolipoamide dehydrogenase (E3) component
MDFDLAVLGLGPGGETVAGAAAEHGWSVLGVDPGLVGGECPYYGCIPSKMMLRGAEVLAEAGRVDALAGRASVTAEYPIVARRIRDEATDDWDDRVAVERFTGKGGTFRRGAGSLAGRDPDGRLRVVVGDETHTAERVVIATGTAPAVPPIDGLAELRAASGGPDGVVWTNRDAVRAPDAPESLIILGGGAIGCEFAQGLARFGTRVTVLEAAPRILGPEEPEVSAVVGEVLRREGVDVREGTSAAGVSADVRAADGGVTVRLADGGRVSAQKLLVAVGRAPNLDDIGLVSVGLGADRRRSVPVDEHMRLLGDDGPVPGLYAVGDVTGHGGFTHVAMWQAQVLTAHLLGRPEHFGGYHGLAWVTFTDPEVGRVGLSEQQARDQGIRVRTGSQRIAASSRGWIHGPGNDGLVKLVADADRGVLVGATVVSPAGGELLGLLTLAVHARVPIDTLATMHYAYPTLHRAILDAVQDLTAGEGASAAESG